MEVFQRGIVWTTLNPDGRLICVGTGGVAAIKVGPNDTRYETFPRVRVLDRFSGTQVAAYEASKPFFALRAGAWSPDGRFVAFIADDTLYLWDPSVPGEGYSRQIKLEHGGGVSLAFSPDATKLAVTDGQAITLFSIKP